MQLEVQISEAARASRELSPEALTQLSQAVKKEELLIMLRDKADNSIVEACLKQAAASSCSFKELSAQITETTAQNQRALTILSRERELGDGELASRLDKIEAILSSTAMLSQLNSKGRDVKGSNSPPVALPADFAERASTAGEPKVAESEMSINISFANAEGPAGAAQNRQSPVFKAPTAEKMSSLPAGCEPQSANKSNVVVAVQPNLTSFLQK
mmetsp:Transcript_18530/g.57043  ORF Transcript_18530/g.57043 Transcript_18530/m.57043 type:complete len:215 (-) Transcript_18530:55-699(-)